MKSTTPRICPQCGAPNTGRSLFCAECGADLSKLPDPNLTRPFEPNANHAGSDQQTEAYAPAWNQTWSGKDEASTTNIQPAETIPAVRTPVTPVQPVAGAKPIVSVPDSETSSRSFYLGLIAILIIIAIALALGWLVLVQPHL